MPIANYTTDIEPDQTVAEIQRILVRAGASSVRIDYEDGTPVSLSFLLMLDRQPVPFRLPANVTGVYLVLQEQAVERKYKTQPHARRVAWRIVKDWVRAQLALIESGQATLPQLFLPHAVRSDGRTLFEVVAAEPHLLLGRGGGDPAPTA